jgi:hypothetical protein
MKARFGYQERGDEKEQSINRFATNDRAQQSRSLRTWPLPTNELRKSRR